MNRFMNFPHTKSNKLDVIVKAQANCRYQRVPLTPDVITENDLSGTYRKCRVSGQITCNYNQLVTEDGEGHGTPLQYSRLENPMDRGAWWAAVHGAAKSRTRLSDFPSLFTFMHWRRKRQPTPVFSPGESQGRGSLVGCRLWGHTESDTTEVT